MGCNCGGSARQTSTTRAAQAELAARRGGETTVFGEGYYFTGPPRPPEQPAEQPVPATK